MRNLAIAIVIILAVVFRFYQLGFLPSSPYWEEAALGYDAYSILKTGRDHHGNWFPVVAFESFGDWKPGMYIYATVPSIFIFGLNTFAVRFPSAVAGVAIVIGSGVLSHILFVTHRKKTTVRSKLDRWLPVFTMLVCAVEPWGVLFSRVGWESNLATAFTLWAMILMLLGSDDSRKQLFRTIFYAGSATLMALAMYTYHAARLGTPVMLLAVGFYAHWPMLRNFQWNKKTQSWLKHLIIPIFLLAILLAPLVINLTSNEVTNRFATTSIFSDLSVIETSNQLKSLAGNSVLSRLLYHRYWLFSKVIFQQIVVNLDLNYLFLHGDSNLRHSIQFFGQLFPLSFPLVLIGLATMAYHFRKQSVLLALLFVLGTLPGALATGAPHAVRTLLIFPLWVLVIGLGLQQVLLFLSRQKNVFQVVSTITFSGLFIFQILIFWMYYSQVYPKVAASQWQYGYQEMIATVNELAAQYPEDQVYITREQGRPAMYYWFYSKTDPKQVQAFQATAPKDQSEFLQFGRFHFIDKPDQVSTDYGILAASPLFTADAGLEQQSTDEKHVLVLDPMDKPIWEIQTYEK